LLQDPRICWLNLNDNLRAGVMLTYPPELAAKRLGIEKLLFGADGDHLVYGALNLGGVGLYSYGACCVFLDGKTIAPKVSFLEENSFSYFTENGSSVTLHVPPGTRALWHSVPSLAVVKHRKELTASTKWTAKTLGGLLLVSCGEKQTDRFIEAQIRQPLTSQVITEIVFARSKYRPVRARGIVGRAAILSRRIAEYLVAARRHIKVRIVEDD